MEQLNKYLTEKEFKTIDISNIITSDNYIKYIILASQKPNVLLYFKRNETNEKCFKSVNATDTANYFLINKNNYLTTVVPTQTSEESKIDGNLKRCVDGFLELPTELVECMICCQQSLNTANCNKCFYTMCQECTKKILKYDKTTNSIKYYKFECPQCRQYTTGIGLKIC